MHNLSYLLATANKFIRQHQHTHFSTQRCTWLHHDLTSFPEDVSFATNHCCWLCLFPSLRSMNDTSCLCAFDNNQSSSFNLINPSNFLIRFLWFEAFLFQICKYLWRSQFAIVGEVKLHTKRIRVCLRYFFEFAKSSTSKVAGSRSLKLNPSAACLVYFSFFASRIQSVKCTRRLKSLVPWGEKTCRKKIARSLVIV